MWWISQILLRYLLKSVRANSPEERLRQRTSRFNDARKMLEITSIIWKQRAVLFCMRKHSWILMSRTNQEWRYKKCGNVVKWSYKKCGERKRAMFKRKIYEKMRKWKQESEGKTALLTKVSKNSPSATGGRWIAEKENRTLVLKCEVWYTIISRKSSRKDRKDWLYGQNGS